MLLCRWWIEQSLRQIAVSVHSPAHDYIAIGFLVKQEVLVERTKHDEKAPVTKARMVEATVRSNVRMLFEKSAGGLHSVEITIRNFPTGVDRVPLVLALDVRDKIIGLAQAHAREGFMRACTRSRIA